MSENIKKYFDSVNAPWGQLLYKLIWNHLDFEGKRILDFGSGFGLTANHLAEKNEVIAVEPSREMLQYRVCTHDYVQLNGKVEVLGRFPDQSFDVILCHNVLEYADNREEIMGEFVRLLKPEGILSVIKHNKPGKIMQKAVFEYNVKETLQLLHNENIVSANFGTINEYENEELETYAKGKLKIINTYGLRMFFALQRNDLKNSGDWICNMFEIESLAEERPEFRNIAFLHHVIMKRGERDEF